jgi:hypothetical protein
VTALPLLVAAALDASGAAARPRSAAAVAPPDAGSAPAPALSDAELAERIQTYLSTIDVPVRAEQWRALGDRAVAPLEAVVQDPQSLPSQRAKALDALSVLGGDRARRVVLETARADDEPFAVRASALRGAGRLLSRQELVRELKPVLESARDTTVRATAAEVLAHHAGPSACGAVRAQAGREQGNARRQFARALDTCAAP